MVVRGLLPLLLTSACSLGIRGNDSVSRDTPGHAAQPHIPPQFTPVAEAGWTTAKPWIGREVDCQHGKALIFDCQDINILAFLPISAIGGGTTLNDIWGWTDSATGREFALVGRSHGTSFVEITDPVNPRYLGELPLHAGTKPSIWRGIKVYKNYAFIIAGASQHGMQVFDLTQLRGVTPAPATFEETVHYDRISSVHNIAINEATGFAYLVGNTGGGETCGSALHMVDIQNPRRPVFAGCHIEPRTGRGYVHDTQCVIYRGPDQQYRGREICFNAAEMAISIIDVTTKPSSTTIAVVQYPDVAYAHQGWLSEDHRYFFLGDENDEMGTLFAQNQKTFSRTRTIVFDLNKLDDPTVVKEFLGTTAATDHNLYVRGTYMYQSNFQAGLRVLDIIDPVAPKEVGYFDTTPADKNMPDFSGSWGNYPYFQSGVIVVASMNEGLFVVRHPKAESRLRGQAQKGYRKTIPDITPVP